MMCVARYLNNAMSTHLWGNLQASRCEKGMADEYGDTTDFMLASLLSGYLLMSTKRARVCAVVLSASACLVLALATLGWSILSRAFLESLSAINQTVGGVTFGAAVLVVVILWEWKKYAENEWIHRVSQLIGTTVLAALLVWSLFFLFKAFAGVPLSINREARQISVPLPSLPRLPSRWDVKSAPPQSPEEPKTLHVTMRFLLSPNSSGPAYSFVNHSDSIARNVAWTIVLWDTELPDEAHTLPILIYPISWIKPDESTPGVGIFGQPPPQLKKGDRLVVTAAVDCPDCVPASYVVSIPWGESGWYANSGKRWKGKLVMPLDGASRAGREGYFKDLIGMISQGDRISMTEK